MLKLRYIMMWIFLLICSVTVIDGAVITPTDLSLSSAGSTGTVDIVLDQAPSTGFAGYQLDISFSKEGIAEVKTVNFPAAFSMNSATDLPASSVSIVAVDLQDQITAGATKITLATLGIQGLSEGKTDLQIKVSELTDDSGSPISVTTSTSSITVGSGGTTIPTVVATTAPTEIPTTTIPTTAPTTFPTTSPIINETTSPTPAPTEPVSEPASRTPVSTNILKASFMASPQAGTPPLTVNFTDTSTGNPTGWKWDFGDGTMATSQTEKPMVHVYGGIGRYSVTLEVSNSNGTSVERKESLIQVTGDFPTGPSGYIMVTSKPDGAMVYSGDRYLGTTPATLIVPAGSMDLTFKKHGVVSKTVHITVRPGEIKLVPIVTLKPLAP